MAPLAALSIRNMSMSSLFKCIHLHGDVVGRAIGLLKFQSIIPIGNRKGQVRSDEHPNKRRINPARLCQDDVWGRRSGLAE
ncbi:hypothetical protein KCU76_g48, partial [Aureobasidium melanogenum]